MNKQLMGEDGSISFERDKYNRKLLDPNEIVKEPVNGNDIYLTIDQKVQTLLEEVMNEVEESYKHERISAIIMNADRKSTRLNSSHVAIAYAFFCLNNKT